MKKTILLLLYFLPVILKSQNLSVGLQACYPLNVNANNYAPTGPALNGTLNNSTPATGHTGLANTAYSLNGTTNSYIELADNAGLKSDSVFFSGWFYMDSLPTEQYLVYTKNSCTSNFEAYSLITYNDPSVNQQVFRVSKANSNCMYAPQINSIIAPVLNTWYHVCFYVDNATMKLYVNGVLQGATSHTIQFDYQPGKSVFLGVTNESNFNLPFKGRVDDVRFYNRELTALEVSDLYSRNADCLTGETVGLKEQTNIQNKCVMYPNPCNEKLFINHPGEKIIEIKDLLGNKINFTQKQVDKETIEINTANFLQGIYFITVFNSDRKNLQVSKIVIAR